MHRGLVGPLRALLTAALADAREFSAREDTALRTAFSSLFLSLVLESLPTETPRVAQLARAQALVAEESHRAEFSPRELADLMHVSLRFLQKVYAEVGDTPAAAIRRVRLERAAALLRTPWGSEVPLARVAHDVGLEEGTLRRAFKREHGVSPRAFGRGSISPDDPASVG